ncbi:MAG: restriction endonuclease subunit S [Clostridiales bacterium]|nr:restriction endonuclease subunit S [Clostridiales bacterium]MCF8021081.1 restriction endonuclease subunit S [Clostridiales bacterium]
MPKFKRYEKYKDSRIEWIGEVPKHWEIKKLKYVSKINMGQSPVGSDINTDEKGLPFLQGNAEFRDLYPKEKYYCESANKYAEKDNILLSVRAPVGEQNIADKKYGIGRGLCAINIGSIQGTCYIWYLLKVVRNELYYKATGSTYEAVSTEDIKNLNILQPLFKEQKAINNFLKQKTFQIDSLITNKEKLIEKLQEYKQSLITKAVTKGLDPNVKMKNSGIEWIGEIPENWRISKIKEISYINPPKPKLLKKKNLEITFLPMEKIKETGQIDIDNTKNSDEVYEGYTYFEDDDVIIAKITPCFENGKFAICNNLMNGIGFGTTELHVLRPKEKTDPRFLYYWTRNYSFREVGKSEMYGAAGQKRISPFFIKEFKLTFPQFIEQKNIADYLDTMVKNIDLQIYKIYQSIQKLKECRQSLITHTVTGKIDVRDYVEG